MYLICNYYNSWVNSLDDSSKTFENVQTFCSV